MASLPRFNPGDPVDKALNHGFLNEIVSRLSGAQGIRTAREAVNSNSTVEVLAINNTSKTFNEFSIVTPVGLGLNLADESDRLKMQRRPMLSIDEPILATDFPCVALEPIKPNGGIGKVAIGGVALCQVNFSSASHLYANPTPAVWTSMTSSASQGYVRVLWKESGTGVKWALVTWEQPSVSKKTYHKNTFNTQNNYLEIGGYESIGASPSNKTWTGTAFTTISLATSVDASYFVWAYLLTSTGLDVSLNGPFAVAGHMLANTTAHFTVHTDWVFTSTNINDKIAWHYVVWAYDPSLPIPDGGSNGMTGITVDGYYILGGHFIFNELT